MLTICAPCASAPTFANPAAIPAAAPIEVPASGVRLSLAPRALWLIPVAAVALLWAPWSSRSHTASNAGAAIAIPSPSVHPERGLRAPRGPSRRTSPSLTPAPTPTPAHAPGAQPAARLIDGQLPPARERARDEAPTPSPEIDPRSVDDTDRGTHQIVRTQHGKVHVWAPPGYRAEHAGVVTYVHGYETSVDEAWREHRLAAQFHASGRNALFVVPAAPRNHDARLRWRSLDALFDELRTEIDLEWPTGPSIVIGHSGAFRSIATWIGGGHVDRIDHVILLDALYGARDRFDTWLAGDSSRRLTIIAGANTREHADDLVRRHDDAVVRTVARSDLSELADGDHDARLLYLRTREDSHMWLVTGAEVIPELLGSTALQPVPPRILGP